MTPEDYDIARHWLLASLNKGRDFIVLEQDKNWLRTLDPANVPRFTPGPIAVYQVPKTGGEVRHVPHLSIAERLHVTTALVSQYEALKRNIEVYDADFWSPLPEDPHDTNWISNFYEPHKKFRLSREEDSASGKYVWQGDIQGFGRSVQNRHLQKSLRQMQFSDVSCMVVAEHSARLRQAGLHGLPVGTVISDILSKAYLATLDRKMANGLMVYRAYEDYYRYLDDLVLTADSESQLHARRRLLAESLGDLGLKLRTDKEHIIRPGDRKAANPLRDLFVQAARKFNIADFDFDKASEAKTFPPNVLFHVFYASTQDKKIPHSVFNFSLHRMATAKDDSAISYLPAVLKTHPERAREIFRYAAGLNFNDNVIAVAKHVFMGAPQPLSYTGYVFADALRTWNAQTKQPVPAAALPVLDHLRTQAQTQMPFIVSVYDELLNAPAPSP